MRRQPAACLLLVLFAAACNDDEIVLVGGTPAPPEALDASYYAGAVTVTWELGRDWNEEPFRVYSRRITDSDYLFIAEVTSCADGLCSYQDWNVVSGETYEYFVAAVDPGSGVETESANTVQVVVPDPIPPPVPTGSFVISLDGANYLTWEADARSASDFSHYKVYQDADGTSFLLGETDSEGFLDLLAANGTTYSYFVTSVDTHGHESTGSVAASGTPRPDFHDEFIYAFSDNPGQSGFRFQADDATLPIVAGDDAFRHFRLESDGVQWWLVPGPGTTVFPTGLITTALKCGVAADAGCSDVSVAPGGSYTSSAVELFDETSYVLQVVGDDGLPHYGVVRVELLGFDQSSDAIMIFSWAYQLQANNPNLVSSPGS